MDASSWNLVGNHFLIHRLKREFALGDIAEHSGDDTDGGITHCLVDHRQAEGECLNEQIGHEDKSSRGKDIPEELYAAVQVRLREHYMPGQNEPRREADSKCYDPGAHLCRYGQVAIYCEGMLVKQMIEHQGFDNDVEHSIRTAAREVAEGLGRDDTGKRPVKKINKPNYDMSDPVVHL